MLNHAGGVDCRIELPEAGDRRGHHRRDTFFTSDVGPHELSDFAARAGGDRLPTFDIEIRNRHQCPRITEKLNSRATDAAAAAGDYH
jgi:hypothetical protein